MYSNFPTTTPPVYPYLVRPGPWKPIASQGPRAPPAVPRLQPEPPALPLQPPNPPAAAGGPEQTQKTQTVANYANIQKESVKLEPVPDVRCRPQIYVPRACGVSAIQPAASRQPRRPPRRSSQRDSDTLLCPAEGFALTSEGESPPPPRQEPGKYTISFKFDAAAKCAFSGAPPILAPRSSCQTDTHTTLLTSLARSPSGPPPPVFFNVAEEDKLQGGKLAPVQDEPPARVWREPVRSPAWGPRSASLCPPPAPSPSSLPPGPVDPSLACPAPPPPCPLERNPETPGPRADVRLGGAVRPAAVQPG